MIYVRSAGAKIFDERTLWYRHHFVLLKKLLLFSIALAVVLACWLLYSHFEGFQNLTVFQFFLLLLFPVIAAWYTFSFAVFRVKKIRQTGWLKSFIVGFIWAGWVIIYPVLFIQMNDGTTAPDWTSLALLFVQNFLFFSINAVIFDMRDYSTDMTYRLKTFPVLLGVRGSFLYVVCPLLCLDIIAWIFFLFYNQFTVAQACVQFAPFVCLAVVLATYRRQRSVLYYLAAVDGLVFVKAISGIISIIFF